MFKLWNLNVFVNMKCIAYVTLSGYRRASFCRQYKWKCKFLITVVRGRIGLDNMNAVRVQNADTNAVIVDRQHPRSIVIITRRRPCPARNTDHTQRIRSVFSFDFHHSTGRNEWGVVRDIFFWILLCYFILF